MTHYVNTHPAARTRHRCGVCRRFILPGETYWRQAGLDGDRAWTNKTCQACERCVTECTSDLLVWEWDDEMVTEWLSDQHPEVFEQMRAGWRSPDGELLPLPFTKEVVS